ncbi:hypothetical protein GCM10007036_19490 [Alsobacter metallidurans]|uniref:4'-phosphopantetheinyl transferase domain-containing protein n=1 Tax=Alsobacter metallidurans TaxID=340221 RepID=A0A917I7J5_9HYPH|nr:4'-phosphopantetheinyl transferase superfamily protein [Alsobacter metallidurans]GGH17779.1 hypothetical protein GCM10007036_19490 [Alsobacter metallidurans]
MRNLPPDFPSVVPQAGDALVLVARIDEWRDGEERLSAVERERLRHLTHPRTAETFVAGRSLLRAALAAVLGEAPETIGLTLGRHDKPALEAPGDLAFNLTHSDEHVALALTRGAEIGLDIEPTAPPEREAVAEVVMTPEELAAFRAVPGPERDKAFLSLWTRKEAILKAAGSGFSVEPRALAVGFGAEAGRATLPGYGGWFAVRAVERPGWPPMAVAFWNSEVGNTTLLEV